MSDRSKKSNYENAGYISGKMVNDLGPKKTMIVLVIVVGCFAVLWPKVFYPMLVGSANNRIKPSPIDRTQGCCDVISDKDLNTIKIMSEICTNIIQKEGNEPLTKKELIIKCQNVVLETCGIDISAVLQEQVRLGHTTKQILQDIRSLNGSLCLKYNFGVAPWKLGVPHRVTVKASPSYSIRQERPLHLRSEMVHPAFRERGRAIPQSESFAPTRPASPSRIIPKIVDGKPGPIPGLRPTIGGAGHVVPPSKHGGNNMGVIMPIYTIGIVVFFTYTVMKIVLKKKPEVLYPPIEPDANFRKEVFEADRGHLGSRPPKDGGVSSKIVVNAMSALLDEVDLELTSRRKTSEVNQQDVVANGSLRNQDEDQSSVQVLGMETTASCEGGQKWTRPDSPILPAAHSPEPPEPAEPPQEIFLEGSLPPQSHLLVTDSATEAQKPEREEDPAVVLAGKMTLSVISLDSSENGTDDSSNSSRKPDERSSSNVSEEFEKIDVSLLEKQIERDLESQFLPLEDDADVYPEVQEEICVAKHAYLEGKIEDLEGQHLEDEDLGDKLLVTHRDSTGESSESKGIAGLEETELSLLQQYLEEDIEQETPLLKSVEQVSSPESEIEQTKSTGLDQESTGVETQSKSELTEAVLEEETLLEQITPNKVEGLEETELFEKEKLAFLQEHSEDIEQTPNLEPVEQVSSTGREISESLLTKVEASSNPKPSEVDLEKERALEQITLNKVEGLEETELFEKEKLAFLQKYSEDIEQVRPKLEPVEQVSSTGSELSESAPSEVGDSSNSKPGELDLEEEVLLQEITSNIVEVQRQFTPEEEQKSSSSTETEEEECEQEVFPLENTPKIERKSIEVEQTDSPLEVDSEESLILQSLENIPIETEQKSSPIEVSPEEKLPTEAKLKTENQEAGDFQQPEAEPSQKSEEEDEEMDEKKVNTEQLARCICLFKNPPPPYILSTSDDNSLLIASIMIDGECPTAENDSWLSEITKEIHSFSMSPSAKNSSTPTALVNFVLRSRVKSEYQKLFVESLTSSTDSDTNVPSYLQTASIDSLRNEIQRENFFEKAHIYNSIKSILAQCFIKKLLYDLVDAMFYGMGKCEEEEEVPKIRTTQSIMKRTSEQLTVIYRRNNVLQSDVSNQSSRMESKLLLAENETERVSTRKVVKTLFISNFSLEETRRKRHKPVKLLSESSVLSIPNRLRFLFKQPAAPLPIEKSTNTDNMVEHQSKETQKSTIVFKAIVNKPKKPAQASTATNKPVAKSNNSKLKKAGKGVVKTERTKRMIVPKVSVIPKRASKFSGSNTIQIKISIPSSLEKHVKRVPKKTKKLSQSKLHNIKQTQSKLKNPKKSAQSLNKRKKLSQSDLKKPKNTAQPLTKRKPSSQSQLKKSKKASHSEITKRKSVSQSTLNKPKKSQQTVPLTSKKSQNTSCTIVSAKKSPALIQPDRYKLKKTNSKSQQTRLSLLPTEEIDYDSDQRQLVYNKPSVGIVTQAIECRNVSVDNFQPQQKFSEDMIEVEKPRKVPQSMPTYKHIFMDSEPAVRVVPMERIDTISTTTLPSVSMTNLTRDESKIVKIKYQDNAGNSSSAAAHGHIDKSARTIDTTVVKKKILKRREKFQIFIFPTVKVSQSDLCHCECDMSEQSMRVSPNYIEYESDSDSETEDANYEKA